MDAPRFRCIADLTDNRHTSRQSFLRRAEEVERRRRGIHLGRIDSRAENPRAVGLLVLNELLGAALVPRHFLVAGLERLLADQPAEFRGEVEFVRLALARGALLIEECLPAIFSDFVRRPGVLE